MNLISQLSSEVLKIGRIAKIFFYFNRSQVRKVQSQQTLSIDLNFSNFFGFILCLGLPVFFLVYVWITILMLIPPASEKIHLKSWFGSGLNIVVFGTVLLFIISFVLRFILTSRYFHQDKKVASLIFSSPLSSKSLCFGLIVASGILEYWFVAVVLEYYIMYRIIIMPSLDLLSIFILILLSLVISFSAALAGYSLSILRRNRSANSNFLNSPLIQFLLLGYLIIIPVMEIITNFQPLLFITPLGWVSLVIYSLFTGQSPEFLFMIPFIILFLYSIYYFIPEPIFEEDLDLPLITTTSRSRFSAFYLCQSLLCGIFAGKTKNLAKALFKEDWASKRQMKFILSSLLTFTILFYLGTFYVLQNFEAEGIETIIGGSELLLLFVLLFSIITSLSSIVHRELSYSFFNYQNSKYSFFRSTPLGIRPLVKIKLGFVFLMQIPLFGLIAIAFQVLYPVWPIYISFPLALGAGLFTTSTNFLLLAFRPRYFMAGILLPKLDTVLLPLIRGVFIFLPSVAMVVLLNMVLPLELVIYIYLIIYSCISYIAITIGIQQLETAEILI